MDTDKRSIKESNKFLSLFENKINDKDVISILFSGVGGQGILLASSITAHACLFEGFDVKVSEVHGMAQRGGSVAGSVRFGREVFSPVISCADIIVSLEKLESLRYIEKLKNDGVILINDHEILPVSIFEKNYSYPHEIIKNIKSFTDNFFIIDTMKIAEQIGSAKIMNVIMIGFLSNFLPVSMDSWVRSIKEVVPKKILEQNLKAFALGKNFKNDFKEGKCL